MSVLQIIGGIFSCSIVKMSQLMLLHALRLIQRKKNMSILFYIILTQSMVLL